MLYIYLLGYLRVFQGKQSLELKIRPKTLVLWSLLLLRRKNPIPRDSLAFMLWPDASEVNARADLRRHLHELEHALPPPPDDQPWLLRQGDTVQWNTSSAYWLDVAEFERMGALPDYREKAAALYGDDLLLGLYDDLLEDERDRLRTLYFEIMRQLIAQQQSNGNLEAARAHAEEALRHNGLDEPLVRDLMRVLYQMKNRTQAIRAYETFRLQLSEEMGVDPDQETTALYDLILGERPLTEAAASRGESLESKHNLPAALTSFFGREEELAALYEMMAHPSSPARLITLMGPPGVGKTRLSVEVGRRLLSRQSSLFPDGIYFIDLSTLVDPALVSRVIANALGVKDTPEQSLDESLKEHLKSQYVLLILDNFEQVIDAAVGLSNLLAAAPGLRVMVTSRAPLKLYSEHEFPVAPLPYPISSAIDAPMMRGYAAVALFEARVQQRQFGFALSEANAREVAAICAAVDGLPLAVELAAGQTRDLSLSEITSQLEAVRLALASDLRDVQPRHQRLQAAIQWSYDLLNEAEQQLFRQLSVFAGGWTLDAAEAVCDPYSKGSMFDGLIALAEKNLIQQVDEGRWRMLATIREFGLKHLNPSEDHSTHRRHIEYFTEIARCFADDWQQDGDKPSLVQRLAQDEDNYHAALNRALIETPAQMPDDGSDGVLLGARLTFYLYEYWVFLGRILEGVKWNQEALSFRERLPTRVQADLLYTLGSFVQDTGDIERARRAYYDSIEVAKTLEDSLHISRMLNNLAILCAMEEKYEEASQLFEESIATGREIEGYVGSRNYYYPLSNLGLLYTLLGKNEQAQAIFSESLAWSRTQNDPVMIAIDLEHLANLATKQKEYEKAQGHYREAVELTYTIENKPNCYAVLRGLAAMLFDQGRTEHACRLMSAALTPLQEMGYVLDPPDAEQLEHYLQAARERLSAERVEALLAEGKALSWDETVAYALNLS